MTSILFLCSTNSSRSQMAEGFARLKAGKEVAVSSAGTEPTQMHPLAVKSMAEVGVDISSQKVKPLADLGNTEFDVVVALCDKTAEECRLLPGHPAELNWQLPDPETIRKGETAALAAFRKSRDEIRTRVDELFDKGYLDAFVESRRCAGLILNNISEGIIAHDLKRRIFFFNKAAETITGYRRDEVLNRDCHDVFPGNFCGGKCSFEDGVIPKFDSREKEMDIVTKSGEKRHVTTRIKMMIDTHDRQIGVLTSFRDLTREHQLARRVRDIHQFSGIIGRDEKMQEVFELIRQLADTTVPVLIQGESGTGKELVAAAIHTEGLRAGRQFVPVNCGALPESLLESELFGHVKGAFTGAIRDKKGRFELADGGTIFLDEIGDITPTVQVRLLRVLQEGKFERVGSETTIQVDVRLISATNKTLSKEIAEGRFRDDLFYRLSVVPIMLPPLRERRNDIPLLVGYALKRILSEAGRSQVDMSPEAMDIMMSYEWPGNVRELQNWLQFALVKCRDTVILPEHLPPTRGRPALPKKRQRHRKLDAESVREALQKAGGRKSEAARLLGVSRATLYRFLDDLGLDV